jgi:uridine kinase
MIATIDGWAGAGKTTLASFLENNFSGKISVFTLHMDDLYEGWSDPLGQKLTNKLQEIVKAHILGSSYRTARFDWHKNTPGEEFEIPFTDFLIIEGVGSGQRAIRDDITMKFWVEIDPPLGLNRVLARDGYEIETQMQLFQQMSAEHFAKEGTADAADYHVNGAH